ncbi:MAG: hypothetical protein OJF51_000206 [Nitrospira sp.]|nr:MAG: hypothetical protein OJF51_000206 [Nitrospira sp.]
MMILFQSGFKKIKAHHTAVGSKNQRLFLGDWLVSQRETIPEGVQYSRHR